MGKMASLFVEIETLLAEGVEVEVIAEQLGVPVSWVRECARLMEERLD
jgi:uncharacterized phage-like protein YoqJ